MRRLPGPTVAGGCRMCPVACERVVYPAGCIEGGCSRAYSYEQHGRMVFGCLEKVYSVEIDLERFGVLQAQKGGFGALRVIREPLPMCRTDVERTFEHRAHAACVNPDFLLSLPGAPYSVDAPPGPKTAG